MIRDIELETLNGAVDEGTKTYIISFFFNFRRNPEHLYITSDMSMKNLYFVFVDFIKTLMILEDE